MTPTRSQGRRLSIAVLVVFAIVGLFIVRLVDLQVVQAEELNDASRDKRGVHLTIPAVRGAITDRDGVVLAESVARFDLTASPRVVTKLTQAKNNPLDLPEKLQQVAAITGDDPAALERLLTANPESDYVSLSRGLSLDQLNAIWDLNFSWLVPQSRQTRAYPNGAVAGNLVGFVGTDGPQNGLEATEDACLASTDGVSTYERGLDGVRLPGSTVVTTEAIDGGTLKLTIDRDLQWFVAQTLAEQALAIGAESATASVVRVADGHLMAMADWPAVDPNNVNGSSVDHLGALSFTGLYEQGSTFKPFSAAMLVDQGVANAQTRLTVPGIYHTPEGGRVVDAIAHADWQLTLAGVIQRSSNVGISQLSAKLDNRTRYDYLRKFGFGEATAVGFQGEAQGWLAEGTKWDAQTKYNISFGQGVTASAAQMASAYQALGNGGLRMPLTLVEGCTRPDGTIVERDTPAPVQVVSAAAANQVVRMMETVATGGDLKNEIQIPGYRVAAKTGTGEIAEGGVYTNQRVVSVAGLAPAEKPEYAVIVSFVKPSTIKTSFAAAGPFRTIMAQVLKTYRVEPSTTPAPETPTTW